MTRTIRDEDEPGVVVDAATVLRCTAKAALYELADGTELWIPHSQVHDDSEVFYDEDKAEMNTEHGRLVVTSWIAKKKGLDG
ncbi:MAG: hypothetical protein GWN84_20730 [Gammaproteobacteria bacterium]|nr:hypothetical protein [Gammaproteobacteria bacterium]NIR85187.1 hypothetical protein [Gammaproteobacteria bacterium]NIU06236.1 hypothetical protein [Gammaproteobacteria bacterium]NIX87509.1 hypothetical protein [Gammaproteobacteria bacterium]